MHTASSVKLLPIPICSLQYYFESKHLMNKMKYLMNRVVCPNFGHPVLTSSFTKFKFLHVNNSFATFVKGLSVLKLFQLCDADLSYS